MINFFENYKLHFKIFVCLIFFLLIEGLFYYYSYRLSYFCFNTFSFSNTCFPGSPPDLLSRPYYIFDRFQTGFNSLIWDENGLVETIQSFLLLFTIIIFLKIIKLIKNKDVPKLLYVGIYIYLLCISYYFLEEISWGQHFFKWKSNEFFLIYNNQAETNIHNISNLFDQLPRGLLTIWCTFSFLIFRIFKNYKIDLHYLNLIFPKKELIYISTILIIFLVPDFIIDNLSLHPGHNFNTAYINVGEIFDFISFRFIRLSEFHELLFCIYLFYHALFFKKLYF